MPDSQILITRPFLLKAVNNLGTLLNPSGDRLVGLDPQEILNWAQTTTGNSLRDSVPQEGLETLVHSLNKEANLSLFGRFGFRKLLRRLVESRLAVEGVCNTLDMNAQSEIREPVVIIGMPRSGTTILHALMHLDRNHRAPLAWECYLPFPAPRPEDYMSNTRIDTIRREFNQIYSLVPDFKKKHYMEAQSPEECISITAMNFVSFLFVAVAYLPTYTEWFKSADQLQNLRWHKRFLKFLQSGGVVSPRWLLKSPVHMMRLPAFFEVYPDAKVIVTHREPARVVPSCASLVSSARSMYTDKEDSRRTGREQLEVWAEFQNRFLADRQSLDREDQIVDVHFDSFVRDQLHVVDSIYERFGWDLHPEDRKKMHSFLLEQPRGKHGMHEYSLEEFGITDNEVNENFADYLDFLAGELPKIRQE